ncbi:MAG: radical SAM family heme chaperone HemW [Lysobacteraceae bacterium]
MSLLVPPPLSLYVHIPWCVRKCPYCDFNSHAARGELPVEAYVDALLADLDQELPDVWGRTVHSVFFGGGTPSLFPPAAIGRILEGVAARLRLAPAAEVTLETNPGTAEHGRFPEYRAAGVNRLSFGVQSFDDGCLRRLGRIHDAAEAVAAVRMAREAGFGEINIDLMYSLPGQDRAMALNDVEQALALEPSHLSHYQLTLEPNTLFHLRPPPGLPDEDGAWGIQAACEQRLLAAGFEHYEVSAWARPGHRCAHNLNYWRFGDYLGIGAGAHGKISFGHDGRILRRHKQRHPARYLESAADAGRIAGESVVPDAERPFEFMLNALRLRDGFTLTEFNHRTGLEPAHIRPALDTAMARGWLERRGDQVRPTEEGHRLHNDLVGLFLA